MGCGGYVDRKKDKLGLTSFLSNQVSKTFSLNVKVSIRQLLLSTLVVTGKL